MAAKKRRSPRPITDEDRKHVRDLHAEGLGRNAIATRIDRSPRTVSYLAEEMGLAFDRTATAVATEARVIDSKARRAAIIEGLYDVAEDDLAYLRQKAPVELVEVSMGAPVRYNAPRLPAQDRKALVTAVSSATTAAARLEALDGDPETNNARSVLGAIADGIRKLADAQEDDVGEG
ncbi:helix-turn-helix domain-containing protein [Streptomyces niveus]|uniref:helix-turn-helix domain-containing protein n=1 Tax=Streptomyces niveus TaxID=193462 RepID=UPI0034234814